jgi:hypothetical protein
MLDNDGFPVYKGILSSLPEYVRFTERAVYWVTLTSPGICREFEVTVGERHNPDDIANKLQQIVFRYIVDEEYTFVFLTGNFKSALKELENMIELWKVGREQSEGTRKSVFVREITY